MKQLLSSLILLFATFVTASAQVEPMFSQTVSPSNLINIHKVENQRLNAFKAQDPRKGIELEEGQMWFSYYDPNGILYEMGSGHKGVCMWAIKIPYEEAPGSTINGVKFLWEGEHYKDLKVFISTSLVTKVDDADIAVIPLDKEDVKSQEGLSKEFVFDQKYPIPAEGAYIGISYDITLDITSPNEANWKDCYPVFAYIGSQDVPNSLFFFCELYASEGWTDYTLYGMGMSLAMDVLLEGVSCPHNAALVADFGQSYVIANSEASIPVTITNSGDKPITSLGYTVETEGMEPVAGTVTLEEPIENMKQSKEVSIPFTIGEQTGLKNTKLTITQVNGEENEVEAVAYGSLFIIVKSEQMKPFIEEFTGTWCGWCPRGTVGMQRLSQDFGDDVVLSAVHYDDPMEVADYFTITRYFSDGFPSMSINRLMTVDPYYGITDKNYGIKEVVEDALTYITPASIKVNATWSDADKTKILVETESTFQFDSDESPFGIGYLLLADGLQGEGKDWLQKNYYSGKEDRANGDEYLMEYVNKPSSCEAVYNHVPIAVYGITLGLENSIEGAVVAGNTISSSFEMDITDNALVQNKDNLSVAAVLINKKTAEAVNADRGAIGAPDGIVIMEHDTQTAENELYNISGQRIGKSQKGINIIRMSNGNTKKYISK